MAKRYQTIWLNGCFDILHRGHIEMFKYASTLGGRVIVGLDTDERVKKSKGDSRPINTLDDRMELVRSIKYVDGVVSFGSDEELIALLKEICPVHRVIGGDYRELPIVGEEYSGEILFFDRIADYSTTGMLDVQRD